MPRVKKSTDANGEKNISLSQECKSVEKTSFRTTLSNFAFADYEIINNSREGRSIIDKF